MSGWLEVNHPNPDERRRGQLLNWLLLGGALLSLCVLLWLGVGYLAFPAAYSLQDWLPPFLFLPLAFVGWRLNRAGRVRLTAILSIVIANAIITLLLGYWGDDRYFLLYAIPVVSAGFVLAPPYAFGSMGLALTGFLSLYLGMVRPWASFHFFWVAVLLFLALMSWLLSTRLELALRETRNAQALYQRIVEKSPAFVYMAEFGKSGRWLYASPQIERLLGFTAADWMNDPEYWYRQVHPDDREQVMASSAHSLQTGEPFQVEYRLFTRQGRPVWVRDDAVVVRGLGHAPYLQGVILDITEAKLAEQVVRNSEDRYRRLFEGSPISLWEVDMAAMRVELMRMIETEHISDLSDFLRRSPARMIHLVDLINVLDSNSTTLRLFRSTDPEVLHRQFNPVRSSESLDLVCQAMRAVYEGRTEFEAEGVLSDMSGGLIDVRLHWSAFPEGERPFAHVIVSLIDLTQPKQRERELEAVSRVSSALRAAHTRSEILPLVLNQAMELLPARSASLILHRPESDEYVIELAYGNWAHLTGRRVHAGEGITGQVVTSRQLYVNMDVRTDPNAAADHHVDMDVCVAGMPLLAEDHVIGVLWVGYHTPFNDRELRLLGTLGGIAATAIHRTSLLEKTQRHAEQMTTVGAIGRTLAMSLDLKEIYARLAAAVFDLLPDVSTVFISRYDSARRLVSYEYGVHDGEVLMLNDFHPLSIDSPDVGSQGQVLRTRQPLIANDLQERRKLTRTSVLSQRNRRETQSGIYVPMLTKGGVMGVVQAQSYTANRFTPFEAELLGLVANTAAVAMENALLVRQLQQKNFELIQAYDSTLEGWSRALDLRDHETEGHTRRVAELSVRLAKVYGLRGEELIQIYRGALLHDIGKMGIPDHILRKPGALSDDELEIMRRHPEYAYRMLTPISFLRPALDIPYCHHEWWNGNGYPRGLREDEIPLAARIFAIIDVWDSLLSDRAYRRAWPVERARQYIEQQSGKQFDPQVVDIFLQSNI